jgi:hypothetical protein
MVTAHLWGHDPAPFTRQHRPEDTRNSAAFDAGLKEARSVPKDISEPKLRGPPPSLRPRVARKAHEPSPAKVEGEPVSTIDWSDPEAVRHFLIELHDKEPKTAVANEIFRNGIINPRALEGFTRDFAKELKSLPPGADRDALAPLIAKLEGLPGRLYQDCVGLAAKTPGEPLDPALAIEHLADLFDDMLLACNQAKKNASTEDGKALIGWLAAMMLASKRMARTNSIIPLIELAGVEGFAALKKTAHQHGIPRSGHSVTYGDNVGVQGGVGLTKGNSGIFNISALLPVGLQRTISWSRDKDGDLNRYKLTGFKAGLKASFGVFAAVSASLGFSVLAEWGRYLESSMDAPGMAVAASQYSVFQGPIGNLFSHRANRGARERHEATRSFKSFWRLFFSGHRDPLPNKLPYFMNAEKMGKGVSRVGIHQAGSQVGAYLDAARGGHHHTNAIDRMLRKYLPRNKDFERIAERQENPENALAALYLDNYNQRISGPDNVTDAKLKGDPRAWQQFTAAVNADLRFTPLSAEAVTGGTLKNVFNTRIAGNADLLGQLYIKKRSVRLSRTNRPIAEMMNIGYLKESDEGFKFLGRLWHDYGEAGTAPSGPRATHPALRLSKKFWPMFGQNKPHARYFDDARRRFYGDPAAMADHHFHVAAELRDGGDPVELMKQIDRNLDRLVETYKGFMSDVDDAMPGNFFSPEPALDRINQNIFGGDYPLDGTPEATLKIQADGVNSFSLALSDLALSIAAAKHEGSLREPNPEADKLGQALDARYKDVAKLLSSESFAMPRHDSRRRAVFRTAAASTKLTTYGEFDFALKFLNLGQMLANVNSAVLPVLPFQPQGQAEVTLFFERDVVKLHSDPGRVGTYWTHGMSAQTLHGLGVAKRFFQKLFGKGRNEIPPEDVDEDLLKEIKLHGFQSLINNNWFFNVTKVYHRLPDVARHSLVEKLETRTVYRGHTNSTSFPTPNLASAAMAHGIPAVLNITGGMSSGTQKVSSFKLGGDLQNALLHFTGQFSKLFIADPNGELDIAATAQAFAKDPMLLEALFSDEGAILDVLNQIIQFDPKRPFAPFVDIDWKTRNSFNPMAFYVDEDRMRVFRSSAAANHFSPGSGKIASAGPGKESAVLELFKQCRRLRRDEPELLARIRELFVQQADWTPKEQFDFFTKTKEGRHLFKTFYSLMSKLAEARVDLLNARGYPLLLNEPFLDSFPTTYSRAPVAAH